MSEQKVRNTFSRIYAELERFHKVVRKDGLLEKNIMNIGGDPTYLQDMREHIDFLMNSLEDAEHGALGHIVESHSSNKNMVTEGVLDGDDEDGFMARSQLYFMARDAIQLHGIINDRDNLPNWVSSKITAASEGIDSVRRYMEYNTQVKGNEYSQQGQMEEDITKFEVEKLEDVNAHSELAMRLAQDFGTEEEQELVADIYNKHMRRGHIERDEQLARDEVIRKYYGSVTEEDNSVEEDYELENIQEMADAYAYSKTADELRKYASQDTEDMDYADFMDTADTLDDLAKANVIQQSEILGDLNARLRVMDTSPREYIYSLMQAHGLMENNAESEERPYVCVHATKGKHECTATSSYGAAKKAASHWKLKSTSGIDAYLADVETVAEAESPMVRATIPNNTSDTAAKLQKLAKEKGVEYARQGRTVTLTGPRMNVRNIFLKMAYAPGNHPEMELVTETKNYEYKDGKVHISRENFRKVHTDYKNSESGKERMVILDPKTQATVSAPVVFTEGVDFEGSADAADPRKIAQAMMKSAKARAKKKAGK